MHTIEKKEWRKPITHSCIENTFNNHLFVIVGPTAGKKSSLAYLLSHKFGFDVVNSDIYKAYKKTDVWVNQVDQELLSSKKYHLYKFLDPNEEMNVFLYQKIAREKIESLLKDNSVILVGGSCLYANAILFNEYKSNIKENQKRPEKFTNYFNKTTFIQLDWEREELYKIINERVRGMFKEGIETPRKILEKHSNSLLARAIGYKEWKKYFSGEFTKEETLDLISKNTRNYSKRQLTWYRNQYSGLNSFKITLDSKDKTFREIQEFVERKISE